MQDQKTSPAQIAAAAFETATYDGTDQKFVRIKDGSPEWIKDAVREAHDGLLPDDWTYEIARDAFAWIAAYGTDEDGSHKFADDGVDIYTSDLIAWLTNYPGATDACDEASEDLLEANAGIIRRIAVGQYVARQRIFSAILSAVEQQEGDDS